MNASDDFRQASVAQRPEEASAFDGGVRAAASQQVDLLDLILILASRKRLIALLTVLGAAAGVAAALLSRPLYTATAVILPPQPQQSTATALMGQIGAIASLAGKDLGLKNPADLYVALLKSRTIGDNIISSYGFHALYRRKTLEDTRKQLANRMKVEAGKDSLIKLSFQDDDARRAADVANRYIDELNRLTSRMAVAESSHRRSIFEKELANERERLAAAEAEMQKTQEATGLIHVSGQAEAAIQAVARLRAEITSRVVAMQVLRAGATEQNPEIIRYQTELSGLREELRKAERGQPGGAASSTLAPAEVPAAGVRYLRSLREVKYHETLVELLAGQFEAARYDVARAAPLMHVVDVALPAEKPAWPPKILFAIGGTFLGGFLGATWALTASLLERLKQDPHNGDKLASLRRLLGAGERGFAARR